MKLKDEVRSRINNIKKEVKDRVAAMRELLTVLPEPIATEILSLKDVYACVTSYGIDIYMPWNVDLADYIGKLLVGSGLEMVSDIVSNDGVTRAMIFNAMWKGSHYRPGSHKFVSINMSAQNMNSTCVMEEIEPETIVRKRWKVRCGDLK